MKRAVVLFLLLLAGCVSFPPEHVATATAMGLQTRNAPLVRYETVDGVRTMFSRDGVGFLDGPARIAVVELLTRHKREKSWAAAHEIVTPDERWRASPFGGYLKIERLAGEKSHISSAYVTPDAFVSMDEKMLPMLQEIDQFAKQSPGASSPILIVK